MSDVPEFGHRLSANQRQAEGDRAQAQTPLHPMPSIVLQATACWLQVLPRWVVYFELVLTSKEFMADGQRDQAPVAAGDCAALLQQEGAG